MKIPYGVEPIELLYCFVEASVPYVPRLAGSFVIYCSREDEYRIEMSNGNLYRFASLENALIAVLCAHKLGYLTTHAPIDLVASATLFLIEIGLLS